MTFRFTFLALVTLSGIAACASERGSSGSPPPSAGAGGQAGASGGAGGGDADTDAAGGSAGAVACGDQVCTDGCCEWTATVREQAAPETCATRTDRTVTWHSCGVCVELFLPCCWSRTDAGVVEEVCRGSTPPADAVPAGYTRNDLCAPLTQPCDGG